MGRNLEWSSCVRLWRKRFLDLQASKSSLLGWRIPCDDGKARRHYSWLPVSKGGNSGTRWRPKGNHRPDTGGIPRSFKEFRFNPLWDRKSVIGGLKQRDRLIWLTFWKDHSNYLYWVEWKGIKAQEGDKTEGYYTSLDKVMSKWWKMIKFCYSLKIEPTVFGDGLNVEHWGGGGGGIKGI